MSEEYLKIRRDSQGNGFWTSRSKAAVDLESLLLRASDEACKGSSEPAQVLVTPSLMEAIHALPPDKLRAFLEELQAQLTLRS